MKKIILIFSLFFISFSFVDAKTFRILYIKGTKNIFCIMDIYDAPLTVKWDSAISSKYDFVVVTFVDNSKEEVAFKKDYKLTKLVNSQVIYQDGTLLGSK